MVLTLLLIGASIFVQDPQQETLPGARNYTRVDATVACGGATSAEAFPELKRRGFAAVINLRRAEEPGADVESSRAAAEAAGLKYIHIPMDSSKPDTPAVDRFVEAVGDKANQPVYIHCGSANRVGGMWLIKRALLDGWPVEKAMAEAEAIGLRNAALKQFALDYIEAKRKTRRDR